MAENRSDSVRVGLGDLSKEVKVAGSESSGGVDDALNCRAIATSKCQSQLDGEVGESSLDRDREDTTGRWGRQDGDAGHEEHSGSGCW